GRRTGAVFLSHARPIPRRRPSAREGGSMTRPRSLRRLMIAGSIAFAGATLAVMIGTALLFITLQRHFERDTRTRLAEQHAADEIVTSIYGQILASYRQL